MGQKIYITKIGNTTLLRTRVVKALPAPPSYLGNAMKPIASSTPITSASVTVLGKRITSNGRTMQ